MVYKSGPIFLLFCHNSRVWQTDRRTDRQTDGQTEFSSQYRVCITCSAVKNYVADFLPEKCNFTRKTSVLRFESPFGWLRGNVRWSSKAHWKARMDFLLMFIELFARCNGLGATSECRFKIGDFAPIEACWPKILGRMGRTHQPFLFSEN